jgi:hypothetical protein
MIGQALLAIGAAAAASAIGFLGFRAIRIWSDAGSRAFSVGQRIGRTLQGTLVPSHYWWSARITAMSASEQQALLALETAKTGLSRADSERCPLCGGEVTHAWTLDASGHPAVGPGPVRCSDCDFRLDACRHCSHFLPGPPRSWMSLGFGEGDITYGRCAFYKKVQLVDQAVAPDIARQLKARSYEQISAPMPIQDSMMRPDSCRAFDPSRKRLMASGVRWPGTRRRALLHLLDLAAREADDESDQHP